MDVARYLERIGFDGAVHRDENTLHALVQAHLHTVPFENLDIHLGVPIVLDERLLYDKIVERRRGGFCYEVNGLLGALLRRLGFHVTYFGAQATRGDDLYPPLSHLALRVMLAERPYLVDVGYGECIRAPMPMMVGFTQQAAGSTFALREEGARLRLVSRDEHGDERGYVIDPRPRVLQELAAMCEFHQTSPESMFTRKRLCTLPTPAGRITLCETLLCRSDRGVRSERELESEAEYLAALRAEFGIELPCMPRNKSNGISGLLARQAVDIQSRARRAWRRWTEPPPVR
ncbi:MAG TPA: arylamine N-acetyltransferase [Haliangium sp.]|nr:arylamine N-acetyltransferase [Haliangium sp.]